MTFDERFDNLPADGWLSKPEAELLWRCCERTDNAILEVGCYHGRSTCLLATFGRLVYCVDPFKGFNDDDPDGVNAFVAFTKTIMRRKLTQYVQLFNMKIEKWEPHPVGLAYLDGDHTFQGTLNQIEVAKRCGAKVIAIHDVNDFGEGRMVKRAALQLLGPWHERVERLAVWNLP